MGIAFKISNVDFSNFGLGKATQSGVIAPSDSNPSCLIGQLMI
jgi:hypothetical protein